MKNTHSDHTTITVTTAISIVTSRNDHGVIQHFQYHSAAHHFISQYKYINKFLNTHYLKLRVVMTIMHNNTKYTVNNAQ